MQCTELQKRMTDKLMELMPDMLTGEDAQELSKEAMRLMLYAPTRIKNPNKRYNGDAEFVNEGPTVMASIAKELMEPMMREVLAQWVKDNHDEILKTIHNQVGSEGENLMAMALGGLFKNAWVQANLSIQQAILDPTTYMQSNRGL